MSTSKAYPLFLELAQALPLGKLSQMFGCPCVKVPSGKAAFCIYKDDLVIKLDKETEREMLAMDGIGVFAPMEGRAMNGWIRIPYSRNDLWKNLTLKAFEYVNSLEAKPRKK